MGERFDNEKAAGERERKIIIFLPFKFYKIALLWVKFFFNP